MYAVDAVNLNASQILEAAAKLEPVSGLVVSQAPLHTVEPKSCGSAASMLELVTW